MKRPQMGEQSMKIQRYFASEKKLKRFHFLKKCSPDLVCKGKLSRKRSLYERTILRLCLGLIDIEKDGQNGGKNEDASDLKTKAEKTCWITGF